MARIFISRERRPGETRVAASPETVKRYVKAGFDVSVEAGAGVAASKSDDAFVAAGATIAAGPEGADLVLRVAPPSVDEVAALPANAVLVSFMNPDMNLPAVKALAERGISTLSMELIPRITRAQSMDALSSQSNLAGYQAVLIGATRLPRFFPLLMTAAGTIKPARVVVMGAGVAGLQAIATAKRLGAVVEVSDIRPAVKEQVESLGARFIDLPELESGEGTGGYAKAVTEDFLVKQRAIVREHLLQADVVITTALIPGRPAPKLIDADTVRAMRPGSVIVDMAAARGGNCELSVADSEVVEAGTTILAPTNLAAEMPDDASALYARNVFALVSLIAPEAELALDLEDEIVAGALLTHGGVVRHAPTAALLEPGASS